MAKRDTPRKLIACCTRKVFVGGKEERLCLSHVPGNEALLRAYEALETPEPRQEEIQRAIDFFLRSKGRNRQNVQHQIDLMPTRGQVPVLPYAY